jgi:Spy/CpxP family protein refolding chaperone
MTPKEEVSMTRRNLGLVTLCAAMLLLPALADAAQNNGGGGFNAAAVLRNPRAVARYLRLTPAQVEQQKTLLAALKTEVEPLRESQKALQEDLREALEAASPDDCAVGAIVVDSHEIGGEIRAALQEYDAAFSAILTAEQLARYEALKVLAERPEPAG